MVMKNVKALKLIAGLTVTAGILVSIPFVFYLKVLPYAVSNTKVINYAQTCAKKFADIDLKVQEPVLKTAMSPVIGFKVKNLVVSKNSKNLLAVKNFNSEFSFAEILKKTVVVNKLTAEAIFADIDGLMTLVPQQKEEKPKQKSEWTIDLFDSLLGVRECLFLYTMEPDTHLKIHGEHIGINNAIKTRRFVRFNFDTEITKGNKKVLLAIKDDDKIYIENKAIYVDNCPLIINNSKMFFNADAHKDKTFNFEVFTKDFEVQNVITLLQTQIVANNLDEILQYFADIKGKFDFNIKLTNNSMNGSVDLKNIAFKVIPVDNIPITLQKGHIALNAKDMTLTGFEGIYDNRSVNKFKLEGTVKDYLKSIDTDIKGHAVATNDFFKQHISAMVNYPIELTGNADAAINLKSKNNIIDLKGVFILPREKNITIGGEPLPFSKATRALTADLHFEDMMLDINSIKYYMESKNAERDARRPIFTLNGQIDVAKNNYVNKVGFEIPDPLPSEFLNAILKQRFFRKGTIAGTMSVDNTGAYPILDGNMKAEKIIIPSQRIFLKSGEFSTNNGLIHLNAFGKYKRSNYEFTGNIVNAIKFPIVIKDVNLSLDYLDVYKAITAQNSPQQTNEIAVSYDTENVDMGEGSTDFDIGNLIIERCNFALKKGVYKDINFGNLNATMSLDKNSILNLDSNKFDIAEGYSSVKVNCDLKKSKYNLRLGVVNVDSDKIASSLLNLKREISGKASGLIDISTDNSLKLDGSIRFLIKNGTIQKVGLVEYIMKVAALFRNPLTMISPSTFSDLVNIPEGNFDKINGEIILKDNVIEMMKIKSSSPQLSSYIAGRYDLEAKDASLRIYTKFSSYKKGFAGALRNISLNSLANRMSMSSNNDANYYAAELEQIPPIEADDKDAQIFLTKVEGDVEHNNFLSSLKKIK